MYNTEYALSEFKQHGEFQLLEKLSHLNFKTIFDVGCNIGEWSRMARSFFPDANIHLFEVAPETFHKLLHNNVIDEKMFPNSYGLSDKIKEVPMKLVQDNDRVSTLVLDIYHENTIIKNVILRSAENYLTYHNINYIDYLKIDTEGHEFEVLQGFMPLLRTGNIGCVQFEYGYIAVLTKNLLIDFYRLLVPLGYELGKISPEGVNFKGFTLLDENFFGPDIVAVHKSRKDIIDIIKKRD